MSRTRCPGTSSSQTGGMAVSRKSPCCWTLAQHRTRIQTALAFARANLHLPLTIEQLADAAHLSPRQFSRAFREETGTSPAKAVEKLRIEAAQLLVQDGRHSIEVVARQTGFGESERMRRAFLRAFGRPPQAIRRDARVAADRTYDKAERVLVEEDA